MVFKSDYFANILWIALYDYIKMYEWLLGVENDIYVNMMYFLLYLDCEKLYVSVELCEEVNVSECICWLIEMLLVNTYMLIELWMLLVIAYMSSDGELLVNTYMLNDWW